MTGSRARAAPRAEPGSVTGTAPRAPTGSGRSWGKSLPLRSGESPECMGRAPLPPGSCGSRTESGGRDRGETPCPGVVRVALGCCAVYRAPSPSTTRLSIVQRAFLVEVAGNRRLLPGLAAVGCQRGGAGGAPGTTRGGRLSKSVAKAPRDRIGREKKRGIPTILLRRPGAIGAFATDLDKRCRRGPLGGAPRVGWRFRWPHRRPGRPWRGGGSRGGSRPAVPRGRGRPRRIVCCAPSRLLRPLTLRCTRRRGVAEGEGAQQRGKSVVDAGPAAAFSAFSGAWRRRPRRGAGGSPGARASGRCAPSRRTRPPEPPTPRRRRTPP